MGEPAHWLDRVFGRLVSQPPFFGDGWGEAAVLERVETDDDPFRARPALELRFDRPRRSGPLELVPGTFDSPGEGLPREARTGHVLWVGPRRLPPSPPFTWVVLAASGEEGFARRLSVLAPLVRRGRCAALLLENPYYGLRRPLGQFRSKVRTVADQFVMNATTILEALGLLEWLRRRGHRHVGVTGYSMGGHMAAYAACHDPGPLAVVPAAAGLSAAPIYTQGALRHSVAWHRLGEQTAARARLGALLARVTETLPPLDPKNPAILVAARRDAFVFPEQVERLAARWPHAELRWVDGGHVTTLVRRADVIRAALDDAMTKLTASPARE